MIPARLADILCGGFGLPSGACAAVRFCVQSCLKSRIFVLYGGLVMMSGIKAVCKKSAADSAFDLLLRKGLLPDSCEKYIVVSGLCDVHVHFREPGFSYKETIRTGSLAIYRRVHHAQP